MTGVYSVDTTQASSVYALLGDVLQDAGGVLHCYSRLPIRQLLRYVDSNTATMWWISEHVTDRSVAPTTTAILGHFNRYMPGASDVVVLEGLDWMVTREDESAVLRLIQTIDGFCRSNQFTVLLPTNALAYGAAFWARLRSIAPPHPTIPEDVVAAVPSASNQTNQSIQNISKTKAMMPMNEVHNLFTLSRFHPWVSQARFCQNECFSGSVWVLIYRILNLPFH